MIHVTPSPSLPVSVERQQQIIDAINSRLAKNPRQGFCFMGAPGTGKTYLMKAIRNSLRERIVGNQTGPLRSELVAPPICTLAAWQENNVNAVNSRPTNGALDAISADHISKAAQYNVLYSKGLGLDKPYPLQSFHFFIDEFDSQPTVSAFSASKLQTLVNACYENAPRICPGSDQQFMQLVVAMNKSWAEFEAAYGTHVARRIAEMCVRIDFNRVLVIEPKPELPGLAPNDAIDDLIAKEMFEK